MSRPHLTQPQPRLCASSCHVQLSSALLSESCDLIPEPLEPLTLPMPGLQTPAPCPLSGTSAQLHLPATAGLNPVLLSIPALGRLPVWWPPGYWPSCLLKFLCLHLELPPILLLPLHLQVPLFAPGLSPSSATPSPFPWSLGGLRGLSLE